ncbi:helix-turn-helix domain-containing protein [uncultured Draconibacterium sp.]|uniref:helix-turn-helix domain-containing protein n=1 Tax=uncultured Draconibacterium sp. TaxID=1573823 RepID=UPI003217E898
MKPVNNSTLPHTEKSIAVLPFVNMSADADNEYFSDGITEEIINALTKISELKVIARTSSFAFKGKNVDVREIAQQLGVSSVLEGSVRKANNRVRITAQLINASDGTHFWSKNFDREMEDIFALQDEISLLIANQIRENFGHFNIQEHLVNEATKSVNAYKLFLKGHFYQLKWDADSIKTAAEHYEASILHDPKFARSYYGLVQSYGLMAAWGYMPAEEGFSKAIENFMIASDLDKTLPEYGQSFIGKTFWMEWDFQATYNQLVNTLTQYPKYTDGLEAMAELFIAHGEWEKAESYIKRAMDVDPLSANHFYTLAHINYYQKKFDQALTFVEKSLAINPEFILACELKTLCLIWLNKQDEFDTFVAENSDSALHNLYFEVINNNKKTLSEATIKAWINVANDKKQMVPYELFILANTNHKNEALEILKQYIAQKRGQIINFRHDPSLESLKTLADFNQLHISNLIIPAQENNTAANRIEPQANSSELDEQMKRLLQFIEDEKPFLDAQLSLSSLAQSIQLHPNKLSYLINEKNSINFNEFINQFRLDYFKTVALNPKYSHLTLLGLAYESGFNSKSVFNSYFKKKEGITPGMWIKQTPKGK